MSQMDECPLSICLKLAGVRTRRVLRTSGSFRSRDWKGSGRTVSPSGPVPFQCCPMGRRCGLAEREPLYGLGKKASQNWESTGKGQQGGQSLSYPRTKPLCVVPQSQVNKCHSACDRKSSSGELGALRGRNVGPEVLR